LRKVLITIINNQNVLLEKSVEIECFVFLKRRTPRKTSRVRESEKHGWPHVYPGIISSNCSRPMLNVGLMRWQIEKDVYVIRL